MIFLDSQDLGSNAAVALSLGENRKAETVAAFSSLKSLSHDLISVINSEKILKFKATNGASFVRAESRNGKISIQSIENLQGYNIFYGADIVKIEAGIMHGLKFNSIKSEMKILTIKKEVVESKQETTTEINTMKKIKTAKVKTGKPLGKIAFVDALLQSGKNTKAEVAEKLNKEFGVNINTAKNTVSWAASTFGGDRHKGTPLAGKKSNHKKVVAKKTKVPTRNAKVVV